MPRASRHYLPNYIWHITQRCHKREFLFKFQKDRIRWRYWLFQATKKYGLTVLNYTITLNHVHLLVMESTENSISRSLQLIAGRTAQEYNIRRGRKGAFWEDRYHATAIQSDIHLVRCMIYIDLNMVRAGVVTHPSQYPICGHNEILKPPARYTVIDLKTLQSLLGFSIQQDFQHYYNALVEKELEKSVHEHNPIWSNSTAVGDRKFLQKVADNLTGRIQGRSIEELNGMNALREPTPSYNTLFRP